MIETVIQNEKLEELKKNLDDKERACEELRSKQKELTIKLAEIRGNLPGLKKAVQDAETRKGEALDAYVMDESKLPNLEKAREAFELARKTESEAMELLSAVERALPQTQQKVVKADQLFVGAKYKLWTAVSKELEVEAREKVLFVIEQAWVAKLAGGGGGYQSFLETVFPQPGIERAREIQKEMGV